MMKRKYMPLSSVMIMTKGAALLAVLLLGILCPAGHEGIAKPLTMTVVHTNNVTGHLFPCPT
jgi:hypothetical protein